MVSKRARGSGGSTRLISGMDGLMAEYGSDVVLVDLLPVRRPPS